MKPTELHFALALQAVPSIGDIPYILNWDVELQPKPIQKALFIDEIVIATSNLKIDDPIEFFCNQSCGSWQNCTF